MKLVVGLGNPGANYSRTRHNVGFRVIDALASRNGAPFSRKRFEGETAEGGIGGNQVVLLKPQTFMNLSGRSVGSAVTFFKVPPADVLVVHDELDLAFGALRFKAGGGSAGHNGLKSITEQMGADYLRLRVGIGKPPAPVDRADHVLAAFTAEEEILLPALVDRAAGAIEDWLKRGLEPAMNELHRTQPA